MIKHLKKAWSITLFSVSLVNIVSVYFFWKLLRQIDKGIEGYLPFNFEQFLSYQANQYSILQIYFIIFSLILAILAILGFSILKDAAEQMAQKRADELFEKAINIVKDLTTKPEIKLPPKNSCTSSGFVAEEYVKEVTEDGK